MERHLKQSELAKRWNLSERTLEIWRVNGQGPCYLKIGSRVLYRQEDIEAYEQSRRYQQVGHPPVKTEGTQCQSHLTDLRSMTLLQTITLPDDELNRLSREAMQEQNHASRCLRRLRNARYLQRMAKAREVACVMAEQDEGGDV